MSGIRSVFWFRLFLKIVRKIVIVCRKFGRRQRADRLVRVFVHLCLLNLLVLTPPVASTLFVLGFYGVQMTH
jgi:hypothetical protein